MNLKNLIWIAAPLALSAGVIWLSAQETKAVPNEGVKVGELAEKLQVREKAMAQKENELRQTEQRLATLQSALEKDRSDLQTRQKDVQDALARLDALRTRPPIEPKLILMYEKMDPIPGAQALRELARLNQEVAVSLLAGMQAKKSAGLLNQLAPVDTKLAAVLSEKVGLSKAKEPEAGGPK